MTANNRQVGGNHYRTGRNGMQHWDLAAARNYDYFQGQITKYVDRWKEKNGIIDLEKAKHFLEKYIESEKYKLEDTQAKDQALFGRATFGQKHPFGYDPAID